MIEATSATVRNLTSLRGVSAAVMFPYFRAGACTPQPDFGASVTSVPSVSPVWKRATPLIRASSAAGVIERARTPLRSREQSVCREYLGAGGHDRPVHRIGRVVAGREGDERSVGAIRHPFRRAHARSGAGVLAPFRRRCQLRVKRAPRRLRAEVGAGPP